MPPKYTEIQGNKLTIFKNALKNTEIDQKCIISVGRLLVEHCINQFPSRQGRQSQAYPCRDQSWVCQYSVDGWAPQAGNLNPASSQVDQSPEQGFHQSCALGFTVCTNWYFFATKITPDRSGLEPNR